MFGRIARQYRRFLFGSLLLGLFMGLALALGLADPFEMTGPPVLFGLALAITCLLVIGLPIAILALVLPGLLPLVELWLVTLLLLALLDPVLTPAIRSAGLPGWSWCLFLLAAFIVTERSLYGPWFDRLGRRDMARQDTSFTVAGDPEEVWARLVPDPLHAGRYYWPGARFLPVPSGCDADMILSLPRRSGAKEGLFEIHVDAATPPTHIRYRAMPLPGCDDPAQEMEIRISKLDDTQCAVTYSRQLLDVPAGKRLFFWLSHDFRDSAASLRARLAGQADRSLQGAQMLRG